MNNIWYYLPLHECIQVYKKTFLTSLCPQPGSEAAAPQAEGGHEEGEETRSQAAICGAGEELSLGCVYKDK